MTVVGEAFVRVRPESAGFSAEAERSIMSSVTSMAKKAAVVFGGAFVLDKAKDVFVDSIGQASDLSESMNKVDVVFGSAAKSVRDFASSAPAALGQTEAQALGAAGTFGNLLRAVGLTEDQSATFSTTMVGLASDLASFNNTDPAEALDALRAGLVGETEPLKRFGVNLNDAALKAKAMQLGLSDGKGVLDASAKAQAAYALIMEQTTLAQGDFARTSGGLANQQRILAAQVDQAKASFGAGLLPALEKLAPVAGAALTRLTPLASMLGRTLGSAVTGTVSALGDLSGAVQSVIDAASSADPLSSVAAQLGAIVGWAASSPQVDALASAFEAIGNGALLAWAAAQNLADELSDLMPTVSELTDMWTDQKDILLPLTSGVVALVGALTTMNQVSSTLTAVRSAASTLGPALSGAFAPLLANPATLIVAGIVALGAAFYVAYRKVEPFRNAVDAVARVVRDVAVDAFNKLRPVATSVFDAIVDGAQSAAGFVSRVVAAVGTMVDGVRSGFSSVASFLSGVGASVLDALQPLIDWSNKNLVPTIAAAGDFIDALGDRLRNVAQVVGTVAKTGFGLFLAGLRAVGTVASFVGGIITDVLAAAWKVLGPIVSTTGNLLMTIMRTVAGVAGSVLGTAFDALATTVKIAFAAIKAVVESVLGIIRGIFTVFAGVLRGDFGKVWDGLVTIVQAPLDAVAGFVRSAFESLVGFIGSLPGRLADIASTMWDGFTRAVQVALAGVAGVVTGAFDGVVGFVAGLPARIAALASGLFQSLLDAAAALPGQIGALLSGLAGQVSQSVSGAWDGLMTGITLARQWVSDRLDDVVGFVTALPERIKDGLTTVTDVFAAPFKAAFNLIAGWWNDTVGGFGFSVPDWVPLAGGKSFRIPEMPELATGALVKARPGGTVARLAEAGWDEVVVSTDPRLRARSMAMLAAAGLGPQTATAAGPSFTVGPGAIVVSPQGSPVRHAQDMLDGMMTAAWLVGA